MSGARTAMKTAFITGLTGQDGSYLAEHLLEEQKYGHVIGLVRHTATGSFRNIRSIRGHPSLTLLDGDLMDNTLLARTFSVYRIDECYNLAAQSFVRYSFDNPMTTFQTNLLGVVNLLEAIHSQSPATRFYQASTSEMYGGLSENPLSEAHEFHPRSPYGCSKLAAFWHAVNMREAYGLYVCNGIAFNHESPRRGEDFVTRKVVSGAVAYRAWLDGGAAGEAPVLTLGNLEARRDWGHARDYVRAMWMMLQQDEPGDYVLATGKTHSVRDLVELAFGHPAIRGGIRWEGEGAEEVGRDGEGRVIVAIDPVHYRPTEVNVLRGDPGKAREVLGWRPACDFAGLVDEMVTAALGASGNRR
jgi:GDPmannose 4,6-dehydratase